MRTQLTKIALAAGFLLAIAFTLSCSGGDTNIEPPPLVSSSSGVSSSTVLRECEAIFNPSNKFCYDGTVYDKCGGRTYDLAYEFCYNSIVYDKCGDESYSNPADKFCYNGTVYNKCGGQTYNPADKVCRNGKAYDKCGSESYIISESEFCYDGTAYHKCDGMDYIPLIQICTNGVAIPARCNGEGYNPLTNGCCGGSTIYSKATQYCSNGTVVVNYDGSVTHEGKTYKTVAIGEQVWMAENLNYNASGSRCYNNSEANCNIYGRLYNWDTAMRVCPSGWHLPSDAEWSTLMQFINPSCSLIGACDNAGKLLKATSGWDNSYSGGSGNGTDEFGFAALPGGYGYPDGSFRDVGMYGYWWSADVWHRGMYHYDAKVYRNTHSDGKAVLFSVRCVRD